MVQRAPRPHTLQAIDAPRERVGWRRGCGGCSSERGAALLNDEALPLVLLGSAAAAAAEEEEEEAAALLDEEIDRLYALPPHELQARFLDLHGPLLGARFGPELHEPFPPAAAGEAPAAPAAVAAVPLPRIATPPWRRACWLALFAHTPFTAAAAACYRKISKKRQLPFMNAPHNQLGIITI